MNTQSIATKFVKWDVKPLESLTETKAYQLRQKLNNGEEMNRSEKNWLAEQLNRNSYFRTAVPVLGWRFDFSDVIKTFLVNQYGQWQEYAAPDKTSLRDVLCGRINQIIELNN
ncbi:MAG: molybdenum ABC transporter ATP-binding protein [Rikenellaceae bacterium]